MLVLLGLALAALWTDHVHRDGRQEAVTVLKAIEGEELVFASEDGEDLRAEAPQLLLPLLEVGREYRIVVDRNRFRHAVLQKIEPHDASPK